MKKILMTMCAVFVLIGVNPSYAFVGAIDRTEFVSKEDCIKYINGAEGSFEVYSPYVLVKEVTRLYNQSQFYMMCMQIREKGDKNWRMTTFVAGV